MKGQIIILAYFVSWSYPIKCSFLGSNWIQIGVLSETSSISLTGPTSGCLAPVRDVREALDERTELWYHERRLTYKGFGLDLQPPISQSALAHCHHRKNATVCYD